MKPNCTLEQAPQILEENINALHRNMLSMRTAAMNEDWQELDKLDTARVLIVDAIRQTKSNNDTRDYSTICQKILQIDQEILRLTSQKREATASKLTREAQFKKACAHYHQYLK